MPYHAGRAASAANNREHARYYFSRLVEVAGPGVRASDLPAVRQFLARN
jgi:hypothetical protein